MKSSFKYFLPLIGGMLLLIILEINTPKPLNWQPTLSMSDKIPYGSYLVFDLLNEIFPEQSIRVNNQPLFESLKSDTEQPHNYIFVTDEFELDEIETNKLLASVETGNHVFIAAARFRGALADSFHLETSFTFSPGIDTTGFYLSDSVSLNFSNPNLSSPQNYIYRRQTVNSYFSRFDTLHATVLGINNLRQVNFIRIEVGEGALFFSSVPLAFTNYNVLFRNNYEYIAKSFSYLPVLPTYWDEYYKWGRRVASSPLRYILSQPALKYAYITMMIGVVLFFIFKGRRRQRIIPVLTPLRNTTVDFVQTVSRLYLQHRNYKKLADKLIRFFLENLRNRFFVKTGEFNDAFYEKLARKSGVPRQDIEELFSRIQWARSREHLGEKDLLNLHREIERFQRAVKT